MSGADSLSGIAATGRSGSIGQALPAHIGALTTRLEAPISAMQSELVAASARSVIHLAAMTSVSECTQNPQLAFERNVEGAVKWFRAAQGAGVKHFVFVSSAHVFQPTEKLVQISTGWLPDSNSVYGRSKLEAERALRALAAQSAMAFSIARVFSVVPKPGDHLRAGYLHAGLERRAELRDFSPLMGYKNVRDFIATDAICEKLLLIIGKRAVGTWHIGTGVGRSVRELAVEVFAANGIQPAEMTAMFPESVDLPNYLVAKPSEF